MASRLKINFVKSSVLLSEDNNELHMRIANMLDCQIGSFPITYFGVPLRPSKLLHEDWRPLLTKMDSRLAGWKGNTLPTGGRLVLVNLVLSSIPLYMTSFHNLPIWVLNQMNLSEAAVMWF